MLAGASYQPDYVAGVSIGAINAAIIVGNKPGDRLERLRAFWERASSGNPAGYIFSQMMGAVVPRIYMNALNAEHVAVTGAPGFFSIRIPPPYLRAPGTPGATSYYDTEPLRATLKELVDFKLLNSGAVRLAVGAVNVRTGDQVYFDNTERELRPEHIMASGALPPGFPAIEIDGELYWDGGVVSNSPLQYVLENHDRDANSTIFQFDLFGSAGKAPECIWDIDKREKEIRFSSRSRYTTDRVAESLKLRAAMNRIYSKLPEELKESADVRLLMQAAHPGKMTIVHLIYRTEAYELSSQDYEFSINSMREHWEAGVKDAELAMHDGRLVDRKNSSDDLVIIDAAADKAGA